MPSDHHGAKSNGQFSAFSLLDLRAASASTHCLRSALRSWFRSPAAPASFSAGCPAAPDSYPVSGSLASSLLMFTCLPLVCIRHPRGNSQTTSPARTCPKPHVRVCIQVPTQDLHVNARETSALTCINSPQTCPTYSLPTSQALATPSVQILRRKILTSSSSHVSPPTHQELHRLCLQTML